MIFLGSLDLSALVLLKRVGDSDCCVSEVADFGASST